MVKSYSFDFTELEPRAKQGEEQATEVASYLRKANKLLNKIADRINEYEEMDSFYYDDRSREIDDIVRKAKNLGLGRQLCGNYYAYVDSPFFRSHENAMKALSEIKSDTLTIDNTLGITETTTEYYENGIERGYREVTRRKDKLEIKDILTYGEVDNVMRLQFEEMKKNWEKYLNKPLLDENGNQVFDEDGNPIIMITEEEFDSFTYETYIKEICTGGEFEFSYKWRESLSMAIDIIPVLGDLKGVVESLIGYDFVGGRELTTLERGLCLLSLIPFVGDGKALAKGFAKEVGGEILESMGKRATRGIAEGIPIFAKELGTNAGFMFMNQGMQEAGINPLWGMLFYQGGRIGFKNMDKIIDTIKNVDTSVTMTKNSIKNTMKSKWESIGELSKKVEDVEGNIKITLKEKINGISEIVFRKEDLTPFERYICYDGCFTGDTLIVTKEGLKRIDSIKVGEYVLARDDMGETLEYKKVLHVMQKIADEFVHLKIDDEIIEVTPNHLFKSESGWKSAEELQIGEGVSNSNGEIKYVEGKKDILYDYTLPIYNLEIEGYHTYFVGQSGILVHNQYDTETILKAYNKWINKLDVEEDYKIAMKNKLLLVSADSTKNLDDLRLCGDGLYRGTVEGIDLDDLLKRNPDELSNLGKLVEDGDSVYNAYIKGHINSIVSYMPNDKCVIYSNKLLEYLDGQNFEAGSPMAKKLEKYKLDIESCGGDPTAIKKITSNYLNDIEISNYEFHEKIFDDTIDNLKDDTLARQMIDEYYKKNPPIYNSDLVDKYIVDIINKTGRPFTEVQLKKVLEHWQENYDKYRRLTVKQTRSHRSKFPKAVKDKLILEWEENTGEKWPTYTKEVFDNKGKIVKDIGEKYDAHHIIENCYEGPHEWWNIYPASFPDEHQKGIHGSGSPCRELFKGVKNNE